MTRNIALIRAGLRQLADKPERIQSGTVVDGSYDAGMRTVSVRPSGKSEVLQKVLLNAIPGEDTGVLLVPKGGSDVVIGCVDGAGTWVILTWGEVELAKVEIGNVRCEMTAGMCRLSCGETVVEAGSTLKIATASENLGSILSDLINAIKMITVPTPSGASGVPVNVADFTAIAVRLSNLLTS